MRKIITISLLAVASICYTTHALGQDTSKAKQQKEINADAEDEDAVAPTEKLANKKMKPGSPVVTAGFMGGLNQASFVIDGTTSSPLNGVLAGGSIDFHLAGVLHIETGLFYAMTGGTGIELYNGQTVKFTVNTVELPVTVTFKFGKPGRNHFCLGIGAYTAYNISGFVTPDDVTRKFTIGSDNNDFIKALDAGVGLDVGYQLKNGLFVKLRGQGGLSNLQPAAEGVTIRTQSTSVSIGYLFGNKRHPHHHTRNNDDLEMKM